jgi:release factor glutamine methyltransferase
MQPLQGKSLLELGCGTGLISVLTAKAGARVSSSDLSSQAIENAKVNAARNHVDCEIVQADLFDNLPSKQYDWIIINPPYYARTPKNEQDLAWYCGEDFDYFRRLFSGLKDHMRSGTNAIMVLSSDTEQQNIFLIGQQSGYQFELILERHFLFERNFLYRITMVNSAIR